MRYWIEKVAIKCLKSPDYMIFNAFKLFVQSNYFVSTFIRFILANATLF